MDYPMDYLSYLGMAGITAASVGVRVAQQLNVSRGYFKRAFITSYVFTVVDGLAIGIYAKTVFNGDWINFLALGTGSALGGLSMMYFYHKKG